MNFKVISRTLLADTLTPVGIYLQLRDKFAGSILLESSDYHGHENSLSYICCDPISSFEVKNKQIEIVDPNGTKHTKSIKDRSDVLSALQQFVFKFQPELEGDFGKINPHGVYGYISYDAVQYFEDIELENPEDTIPEIRYHLYRYVIAVDHFSNELVVFQNMLGQEPKHSIDQLVTLIKNHNYPDYDFSSVNGETSNLTDEDYLSMVESGIDHCHKGDVFQIVLSRKFEREFTGDEFKLYRALRSVNPSPYLFYFDFGSFKLLGSSPEAQIVIHNSEASIFPIAGTFKRTGNDEADAELARSLAKDEKENSEHVMLVDLARNDLSRSAEDVRVEVFKEVQFYSHVIHLVSKVTGRVESDKDLSLVAATFPAGTLSGAPKHKAMQLIDQYEHTGRANYGGAIGAIGFDGSFNHAIMIRTFLSKGQTISYQAGAGVVAKSNPLSELQEVNNKLEALRKAIQLAEKL